MTAAGFDEAFFAASACSWRRGLEKRDFSARELLGAVWDRILERNPRINALAAYDYDSALNQAGAADAAYARGAARPLEGLPITIKDSFETAGLATACGDEALAEYVPRQDAEAVARLRAAGAIVLAKTNVPRLTADFQTFNSLYGATCNPWDEARTPGGSSGGAAAAVASGFCAFDLASDLGGSIRWPAQACGLFGLKPSWRRISLVGHIPPLPPLRLKNPPDLAVAGPLARSAADLDLALSLLEEPGRAGPPPRRSDPAELRLALWLDPDFAPVDPEVEAGVRLAAQMLRDAGAAVTEARPAFAFAEAFEIYVTLNFAIGFAGAPREKARFAEQARNFEPDDLSYPALRARAANIDATAFARLTERRKAIGAAFAGFFERHDAILCPPAPCLAVPHDFSPDPFARRLPIGAGALPYHDLLKWAGLASLALLPAAVAPVALTRKNLPTGVQIVCARGEDRMAVALAGMIEKATGGFRAPK
ncbi:amidase family protein [Rhodoblastus sp.]|uniref:amidase family protein n=1 Tax=Rhodoblastus sp. TaxID=1962975 RepID=UPI003F99DEFB